MSDDKDAPKSAPEQLTDEQLEDVTGAGKFSALRAEKAAIPGKDNFPSTLFGGVKASVNNGTVFAGGDADGVASGIKGADKLKR